MNERKSSRLKGFYKENPQQRQDTVVAWAELDDSDRLALSGGIDLAEADVLVENAIGIYALPLASGSQFHHQWPGLSDSAGHRRAFSCGGDGQCRSPGKNWGADLKPAARNPVMIGQIQLLDVPYMDAAIVRINSRKAELLAKLDHLHPTIRSLGGGPIDLQVRKLTDTPVGPMLVVHLLMDTRDAMGANAINTACETLSPELEAITEGRALLRILSNLSDQRLAWATCRIPVTAFDSADFSGEEVAQGIVEANAFAYADPYRAATHNKGIFQWHRRCGAGNRPGLARH